MVSGRLRINPDELEDKKGVPGLDDIADGTLFGEKKRGWREILEI